MLVAFSQKLKRLLDIILFDSDITHPSHIA